MDEQNLSLADYYSAIKAEHEANNAWSAEQAQKAMDYQTEMSNTAHQREVADLKAAGLNPVLSAGGQGATTGSGIAAQRGDENVQALYGLVKQAIDANLKQAQAMANTAKYVSGSSGSSNPVSILLKPHAEKKGLDSKDGSKSDVYQSGDEILTSKDLADLLKAGVGVFTGKGNMTDLKNAGKVLFNVIGERRKIAQSPEYQAKVKEIPNTYFKIITKSGTDKAKEIYNDAKGRKSHSKSS